MAGNTHHTHQPPPRSGGSPFQGGPGERFFDRLRGLGIVRSDQKVVAGVCGALAERIGVDVNVVRVVWAIVTVTLAGGPGLIAYLLGWLFLPQRDGRIVAQEILGGRARPALFITALVLLIGLPVIGDDRGLMPTGMFIGLVITGFCAWLWWSRRTGCQDAPGLGSPHGSPGAVPGRKDHAPSAGLPPAVGPQPFVGPQSFVAPQPSARSADQAAVPPAPGQPGPPDLRKRVGAAPTPTASDDDEPAQPRPAPPYVASPSGPAENPDWRSSYQSPPAPPATSGEPVPAPVVVPPRQVRRRPPGARIVTATAGLALVAAAVTLLWTRGGPVSVQALWAGIAALVVLGLATVIVGLAGRRAGMLATLSIPALVVTGAMHGSPQQILGSTGSDGSTVSFADQTYASSSFTSTGYQVTFGSLELDYSQAAAPSGAAPTISAQVIAGSLVIKVPDDVKFRIENSAAFGDIEVYGSDEEPLEGAQASDLGPASRTTPDVILDVKARFASIEIRQVHNDD